MADSSNLEELYGNIVRGDEVRQSLISVREKIKDESLRRKFMYLLGGDFSVLTGLLQNEDPKVRKNAVLILGQTEDEDVLEPVISAWKMEQTLFIREDYLKAIGNLDYERYLPELRQRLAEIENGSQTGREVRPGDKAFWDNNKHLAGEASCIRKMLQRYEKQSRHTFTRIKPAPDLMLVCNRCQVNVTAEQVTEGDVRVMKGGVHVKHGDLEQLMKIRTWSECLFPIPGGKPVPADEKQAAQMLSDMKLYGYLKYLHGDGDGPYRYRIELRGRKALMEKKGAFIRGLASRLDMLEKGRVRNDDANYEAELRLIERSDGTLAPMLKLFTLKDRRFAYRKASTAQSMSPVNAALVLRLALPYLRDNANVLDPFCGTGTLLIERGLIMPFRSCYGIDKFGDAVLKARVNTGKMPHVNYINRDFFDFTHDYLFDELITELPDAEDHEFERHVLTKAMELLEDHAEVIIVTRRPEVLEAAAELLSGHRSEDGSGAEFELQDKFLLNERLGTSELVFCYHKT